MGELTTILEDLLGDPQFLSPLGAGAVILLAFYLVERVSDVRPQGWALVYGVTVLAVLVLIFPLQPLLLFGLALVVGAGVLVDVAGRIPDRRWRHLAQSAAWALVALCVVLFSSQVTADLQLWMQITLPLWAMALAVGARHLDRSSLADILAPLLAVTVVGIWVTVPETDRVEALLGASLPMALVTLPPIRARATTSGLLLVACLLGWLTLDGGGGRVGVTVGGLATAGMLLLVPLAELGRPGLHRASVFATHLVYVVIATRLVDWLTPTRSVLIAISVLTVAALLALFLLARPVRDREEAVFTGS